EERQRLLRSGPPAGSRCSGVRKRRHQPPLLLRRPTVGITSSTALWYASRATGVVALVLLTAVVLLGIMVNRQRRLPGLPRFATTSLHRSLSLLAVVFTVIHVVTA